MITKITNSSQIVSNGSYDAAGVIVTGQNNVGVQVDNAAVVFRGLSNVTIDGLTVQGNKCSGAGFFNCRNITLTNWTVQDNGPNGIGFETCDTVLMQDGVVRRNNLGVVAPAWAGKANTVQVNGKWYLDPAWEGGGGKDYSSVNVTYRRVWFDRNGGPDHWADGYNKNFLFEDCWFTNSVDADGVGPIASWTAMGLSLEIDYGPMTVRRCYFDAQSRLAIQESTNITVEDSIIAGGIEFRALAGRPVSLGAVTIRNCQFKGGVGFSSGNSAGRNIAFIGCVADTQAVVDQINAISPGGCKLTTSPIAVPTNPPGPIASSSGGDVPPVPASTYQVWTDAAGNQFQRTADGLQIQAKLSGQTTWTLRKETASVKADIIVGGIYYQLNTAGDVYAWISGDWAKQKLGTWPPQQQVDTSVQQISDLKNQVSVLQAYQDKVTAWAATFPKP